MINDMETTVSQMTVSELRNLIADVVEEKLTELIDREDDLEVADELKARLLRQKERIENGERGVALEDVVARLGLN